MIERIVAGRIVFTPFADGSGYRFEAPTRYDRLFSGVSAPSACPSWIPDDPRGTENIGPEDTFEADYDRLLERAQRRLRERGGVPGGIRARWRTPERAPRA